MKKIAAMLVAATLIVAAAGCVNKAPQPEQTTESTAAESETSTGEGYGAYTKITQYTTRKPSPSRLTTRPTTQRTRPVTTAPATVKSTTTKPTTTKPSSTTQSFKEPIVQYGGVLGTGKDSVQIKSHTVALSQNNSFIINLKIDILASSGTTEYIYIGFDCYDDAGKKINDQPTRVVVSVRQGETQTISIAIAPLNTAKIVFTNI